MCQPPGYFFGYFLGIHCGARGWKYKITTVFTWCFSSFLWRMLRKQRQIHKLTAYRPFSFILSRQDSSLSQTSSYFSSNTHSSTISNPSFHTSQKAMNSSTDINISALQRNSNVHTVTYISPSYALQSTRPSHNPSYIPVPPSQPLVFIKEVGCEQASNPTNNFHPCVPCWVCDGGRWVGF